MSDSITIRKPDDFHVHLRKGHVQRNVIDFTAKHFKRALIMPNTDPPILDMGDAIDYENTMRRAKDYWGFAPLMTIQLTDETTCDMIADATYAGVVAAKLYPRGVTTNSQNGVSDTQNIYHVFSEMQRRGMLLLIHGELPGDVFCLEREEAFFTTLFTIAEDFPKLKIVLEHITTEHAICAVVMYDNIAATITAHHLLLTLDDVVGGSIQPHNFCKPIAKRPKDREALLRSATSGRPKFFFGSDSAPHLREKKECAYGCAGVFSAPIVLSLLTQIFEERGALEKLEDFVSGFGADFYGLHRNAETIDLVKEDWTVPKEYDGIVPFMAGQTLRWQVKG